MTEELNFEAYLVISRKKFEIQLLDKKNLKNIFKEQTLIENYADLIDYNLLSSFLDETIFKIEKLIGKFLKNIFVIIENTKVLNSSLGIKKKNYTKLSLDQAFEFLNDNNFNDIKVVDARIKNQIILNE